MWPFHRHRYSEIHRGVGGQRLKNHLTNDIYPPYDQPALIVTMITERCTACGKHKQYTLYGVVDIPNNKEAKNA